MDKTNISGLIFEGIAGTGKTTTLTNLLASDSWNEKPFLSSQVLSEHHTMRVLEKLHETRSVKVSDSTNLLNQHVTHIENIQKNLEQTDWLERDRTNQKFAYIFERFHLSHAYLFDTVTWRNLVPIDQRLLSINARICLFTIHPDDIQERIIEDYKKADWQDYLKTLGSNDNEVKAHYIRKQDELVELASKSMLPVKIINSSRLSPTQVLNEVIQFWNLS